MKTQNEEDLTRTVLYGTTAYNLLAHGITYCPECGGEVINDYGACYNGCVETPTLETSTGGEIPVSDIRKRRLNKTAMKMITSKIDWSGVDIIEWYEEFGTFKAVAEVMGVSERSVKRRYDAVRDDENDKGLNSFY